MQTTITAESNQMEKVGEMHEQMGDPNRQMEIIKGSTIKCINFLKSLRYEDFLQQVQQKTGYS